MSKHKRSYNLRLIKATWPYTVQEVAALFGIHKNAVLRWVTEGLPANKDKRPFLIRGDELSQFLSNRQRRKKRKCAWNECFCFKCRAPREAYLSTADIVIESSTRFRLKALCTVCGTPMNKVQAYQNLQRIRQCFHIKQLEERNLRGCIDASVNRDLEDLHELSQNQPKK